MYGPQKVTFEPFNRVEIDTCVPNTSVTYCAPWRCTGSPACDRAFQTVIPTLTPHPVQMNRQLSGHRDLRDFPSSAHGQRAELTAPLRLTAHRDLRRFHQQELQSALPCLGHGSIRLPRPSASSKS